MMIDGVNQVQLSAFDVVKRCDDWHYLMTSCPESLADVTRRAAKRWAR